MDSPSDWHCWEGGLDLRQTLPLEDKASSKRAGPPSEGGPATQGLQPSGVFAAKPPERLSNPADQKSAGGVRCHILNRPVDYKPLFEKKISKPLRACPRVAARRSPSARRPQSARSRRSCWDRKLGREMAWRVRAGPPETSAFRIRGCPKREQGLPRGGGPAAQGLQPSGVFSAVSPRRYCGPLGQKPMGEYGGVCGIARPTTSPFLKKIKVAPDTPPRRCKAKPFPSGGRSHWRILSVRFRPIPSDFTWNGPAQLL